MSTVKKLIIQFFSAHLFKYNHLRPILQQLSLTYFSSRERSSFTLVQNNRKYYSVVQFNLCFF